MASKKKKQSAKPAPRSTTPKATPAVAASTGPRSAREPVDLSQALLNAWRVNERINQQLLDLVAPHIWRAFPTSSKRRNIATSFAHIHNVRCMRIKMCHSSVAVPERLDRAEITPDDARKALAISADAMTALIRLGLDAGGHVPNYRPDVVAMVCGAMVHEAHHRGQISHWCRELGVPITAEQSLMLWEWDKIHKTVNR
jgi:DinB family protein